MLETNGVLKKIVIDKSGANTAGIRAINKMLLGFGCPELHRHHIRPALAPTCCQHDLDFI